jgi:tyrosyl-tRNA synthetase
VRAVDGEGGAANDGRMFDLIDELKWRGLFHSCTNEAGLRAHLAGGKRLGYVGFDPTSDSLTIGNLLPIMLLVRMRLAGHSPVVVMGGGTGMIGDPSGKSAERQLQTTEMVEANVRSQRGIFERVFTNAASMSGRAGAGAVPPIVNNAAWLEKLGYLEALRDIGKFFSVNMMIQKDSVKGRLESREQGISYTEFSYMILQAYDFRVLFARWRELGLEGPVTVQMGASDQYGNIVGGIDLIRRMDAAERLSRGESDAAGEDLSFGLTIPLVTKADGTKFGKSESGAVWLSPHKTGAYAFYQFWLNASDADVGKFLRFFTLLPRETIEALEASHAADPGKREAGRELARHMTELVHGPEARDAAERAAKALFTGELGTLSAEMLDEVLAAAPTTNHDRAKLEGEGVALLDLLREAGVAKSNTEARQLLTEGSISVNGQKAGADGRVNVGTLLHGRVIALRRGKKNWHVTRWA